MSVPTRGVTMYGSGLPVAGVFNDHPALDIFSMMVKWNAYETAKGTYSSTIEGQLAASIAYMLAHDKAAILRPMGGIDSPDGRPGTSLPSWLIPRGVDRVRTLDNEISLYSREVYVPDLTHTASRDQYVADLADWTARIASKVSAHGGTILCCNVPGTEDGGEMSSGYASGGATVYANCGTLASAIATTAPISSFGVSSPSGATSASLFKIGSELFHGTRSGGTVSVARRAHSGSIASTHSAGAQVQIATSRFVVATFDGYGPAPYAHDTLNEAQWLSLGTLAANRAGQVQYWIDATLAMADQLPPEIGVGVSGGQLFGDALAGAHDVLDAVGPVLGPRLWAWTTNLTDGYDYPDTHPNETAWLHRAQDEFGAQIALQTENVHKLLEPPVAGSLQRLVDTCQFGKETFNPRVMEVGRPRFENHTTQATVASGDWPGGTTSEPGYLIGAV